MKPRQYKIILFVFIFTGLSYGQTAIEASLLVGVWNLDDTISINSMELSQRAKWDTMPIEKQERILQHCKERKLELTEEGQYMLTLKNGKTSRGAWTYSPGTNSIEITHANERISNQMLKLLNTSQLVLVPEQKSHQPLLISELHYIKTKTSIL